MPEWRKVAHEATKLLPEADELKRASAEAYLDAVCESKWVLLGHGPSAHEQDLKNLNAAASLLQAMWDAIKSGEGKTDISLPNNLAIAYRILDKTSEAAKVLDEALAGVPNDRTLIKLRAICHISMKERPAALKLLREKRDADPDAAIIMAELLLDEDQEEARNVVSEIDKPGVANEYRIPASLIRIESYCREGKHDIALDYARTLAAEHPAVIEVIVTFSNILRKCGDESAEETLFKARDLITEETPFADRFLVARTMHQWDHYDDAVEILDGYIDFCRDTPALQLFLSSLINADLRRRAFECIKSLPRKIAEKPWYLRMRARIDVARGDYLSAEKTLDQYLTLRPDDLSMRHRWVGLCCRRQQGIDKVKTFLQSNVEDLEGSAEDRMQLAILLEKFGFEARALRLGYEMFLKNPDKPEIHVKYMALLLQPGRQSGVNLTLREIAPDAVFVIDNNRGESTFFLIEEDKGLRISEHAIPPDHQIFQKARGLKVGDSFVIDEKIDPHEIWRIKSIKHKYLDALHRCAEHFNRQFPSFQGFRRVMFDPKAPQNILEPIRKRHDSIEAVLDQYEKMPMPIELLADSLGVDVIKALQGISESKRKFRVCVGDKEEKALADEAIEYNSKRGCVVDALTLHIVRRLGLEEPVADICGPIGMTESSVDVLRQRREEVELYRGKPFMIMSWQHGKYLREEITADRLSNALHEIQGDLAWIEKNCDILPAESDLEASLEFRQLSRRFDRMFFDTILAADGSNRLLLCEDYHYRSCLIERKLPSSWLQPVLIMARKKKILSEEKYDDSIYYMLESGFVFITIDTKTLARFAASLTDSEGRRFRAIAEALGGPDANMESHIFVAASLLSAIWKEHDPPLKSKTQTGKVIECLLRGRDHDVGEIISQLIHEVKSPNVSFQRYLQGWLRGHFYMPFT